MSRTGLLASLRDKVVVHFAPEPHLSRIIAEQRPARYVQCDLFPSAPLVQREDMLSMSFDTGSVDVFIANHVLEHVSDDGLAVREVARVLKEGGLAILQTPFSPVLSKTWEDAGITTDAGRLHAFGQRDHVRFFGRDIVERIAISGLSSKVRLHSEVLADVDPALAGVNSREPFLLFEKRAGAAV